MKWRLLIFPGPRSVLSAFVVFMGILTNFTLLTDALWPR